MSQHTYRLRVFVVATGIVLAALVAAVQVTDYRPVTAAMALNPDPADWLHFRRTLDGQGYSPLNQINRQNVGQLRMTWARGMAPGVTETVPIVYDVCRQPGGVRAGARCHQR